MDIESGENQKVKLDDFSLLKVLGKGTYAKVVLVRKRDTGVIYAMKIIKKNRITKAKQKEHIYTEKNVLANIKHPFIIKLLYTFTNETKIFFVLEYCPGGELFYLLQKKQRLKEDHVKFYLAQIVLAIETLHQRDVIYRDLKPENVLIDSDGYLRITDFGLSKTNVKGNSEARSFCGTPEYLAPEIIFKMGHGKAADWWTLGCFAYELLIGKPPFYGQTKDEIYEKIKFHSVKYPLDTTTAARSFLEGLFNKNPEKRLGSGPNGVNQIKNHPFFHGINWSSVLNKLYKPPFRPNIKSEIDISNFDPVLLIKRNLLNCPQNPSNPLHSTILLTSQILVTKTKISLTKYNHLIKDTNGIILPLITQRIQ